jgi:GPH family glycoside/pentoside/hexuronide:cation symporter
MNTSIAEDEPLPFTLKAGWGVGALGAGLLVNGVAGLALFYMVGVLKIEPALAGAIIFIAKIIDVITDPIMGTVSDRHRSPKGRRRPFLPTGAVLSALGFLTIFTVPGFESEWVRAAYVFGALTLYTIGYTIFNIPFMSMPAEMTDSYHERSSIQAYRLVFASVATFIAAAVGPTILDKLGKAEWSSYAAIAVGGSAIIFVTMMISYFATAQAKFTERSPSAAASAVKDFRVVIGNPHFRTLIAVKLSQLVGFQVAQAAFLFFILQRLRLGFDILLVLGSVSMVASFVATPLVLKISRRYGKRIAYYVSAFATLANALSWSAAGEGEPMWALVVRASLSGIAFAGNVVIAMSMLSDIINHDAKDTGVPKEGSYTAIYSFVEKLTAAIGPLVIGAALSVAGFDTSLAPDVPQGERVGTALLFCVSWLPAVAALTSILVLSTYKLSEGEIRGVAGEARPGL